MAIMSSRSIRHELCREELIALGAKVLDVQGIMYFVKFNFNKNIKITYVYHVNPDGTFFLERIKPYTCALGDEKTEEDVVKTIKIDIELFKNAMRSSNFGRFIYLDQNIAQLVLLFEDLFLYYNIEKDDLDLIGKKLEDVLDVINTVQDRGKRVYDAKDPEFLRKDYHFPELPPYSCPIE